jgi:hypothetical protein
MAGPSAYGPVLGLQGCILALASALLDRFVALVWATSATGAASPRVV